MIILPAVLESFRSLKDKSYKIVFESIELTPEQVVGINGALNDFGYLAFKEDTFKQSEKDMMEKLESDFEDKKKTPGQRLRGVLYRVWEQDNEGYTDFGKYYDFKMERLISHFKEKLT